MHIQRLAGALLLRHMMQVVRPVRGGTVQEHVSAGVSRCSTRYMATCRMPMTPGRAPSASAWMSGSMARQDWLTPAWHRCRHAGGWVAPTVLFCGALPYTCHSVAASLDMLLPRVAGPSPAGAQRCSVLGCRLSVHQLRRQLRQAGNVWQDWWALFCHRHWGMLLSVRLDDPSRLCRDYRQCSLLTAHRLSMQDAMALASRPCIISQVSKCCLVSCKADK